MIAALSLVLSESATPQKPLSDAEVRVLIADKPQYVHGAPPKVIASWISMLEESFDGIGNCQLKGDVAFALGDYCRKVFDAEKSIKYFAKSVELYKQCGEWGLYMAATKAYCNMNMSAGNFNMIEPTLKKCLEVSKNHNAGFYVLGPLQELTVHLSYTTGRYSEAIKYGKMFMDSLEKYERQEIKDRRFNYIKTFDAAVVNLELGHSYLELEEFDKASVFLLRAQAFFSQKGYADKLTRVYGHLAVLAGHQKRRDSLVSYLDKFDYYRDQYRVKTSKTLFEVPGLTRDLHSINEVYVKSQWDLKEITKRNAYVLAIFVLAVLLMLAVFWAKKRSRERRIEINELLQRDFERSQRLNAEKTRYFSILSHELRTPIFAITGLAKLLGVSANNTRENTSAIINSGNHLLHLINNVLQHSKLEESDQVILEETEFEMMETLAQAFQTTSYLAEQKNVSVDFKNYLSGPQHLSGDKQKFIQILVNLISNAIRFSHRDGKVEVTVKGNTWAVDVKEFSFHVRDYGIGIDSTQIPVLFDYRKTTYGLESTGDDNLKGIGVGLFVVANFIHAMGSEIFVESKPGEGANFHFKLKFKSR